MAEHIHSDKAVSDPGSCVPAPAHVAPYRRAVPRIVAGRRDENRTASSRDPSSSAPEPRPALRVGCRIRLADSCPIESEGVAPRPGDLGELLAGPSHNDKRRCWTVKFYDYSLPWSIPEQHLLLQ
ncbi:MAG: hypothetical protein KDK91_13945 [Gammaproteobacteria bacterium]|nr:hypothetical protein [Gammaproteobacteria bacterium]